MTSFSTLAACVAALILIAGGAEAETPRTVHVGPQHYRGTWLEIGRRPMWITDGCVAGYTTYKRGAHADEIMVEDGCFEGSPQGKRKTIIGKGKLLDAGADNAKLRVRYPFFITFNYWVLYEAPDHSWFISADPDMRSLWIYARKAPDRTARTKMIRKAAALGYDVRKLEFPAQK